MPIDHDQLFKTLLKSENPVAYALMAKMNYDKRQALGLKQDFFRLVIGCGIDPARKSLLLEFIDTYMRLDKKNEKQFNEVIFREPEFREVKKMATTWELAGHRAGLKAGHRAGLKAGLSKGRKEGMRKGLREGLRKGIQEGRMKGKRDALLLAVEKKFGSLSPDGKRKVRQIESARKLDSLLLRVLDAQSIEELGLE